VTRLGDRVLPGFLLPETTVREAGSGSELDLGDSQGRVILLTLGITRIIEQESLDVSIWGSANGNDWGAKPLISFPQKFYCGTYQVLLDLAKQADVRFLRVKWSAQRWGKGANQPLFAFYVFAQEMKQQVLAMGA
jgi:hypothetical protein